VVTKTQQNNNNQHDTKNGPCGIMISYFHFINFQELLHGTVNRSSLLKDNAWRDKVKLFLLNWAIGQPPSTPYECKG